MARLRKAARIWGNPKAREIGERVLFTPGDNLFTIDPPAMFGRRAPVEIEIGAGKGEFIIERAAEFPDARLYRRRALLDHHARAGCAMRPRGPRQSARRADGRAHARQPDARRRQRQRVPHLLSRPLAEGAPRQASAVHADARREPVSHGRAGRDRVRRDRRARLCRRDFPDDARGGIYPRGRGRARCRAHRLRAQVRRRRQAVLCGLIPPSARVQKYAESARLSPRGAESRIGRGLQWRTPLFNLFRVTR